MLPIKAQDQAYAGVDTSGAKHPSPEQAHLKERRPSNLPDFRDDEVIGLDSPTSLLGEQNIDDVLRPSVGIIRRDDSSRSNRLSVSSLSGTYEICTDGDILSSTTSSNSLESTPLSETQSFDLEGLDAFLESKGDAAEASHDPLLANDFNTEPMDKAPTEMLDRLLGEVSRQEEDRLRSMGDDNQSPTASEDEAALNHLLERVNLQAESKGKALSLEVVPSAPFQDMAFDFDLLVKPKVQAVPWEQDSATGARPLHHAKLLRGLYPVVIAALVALGMALFVSCGGFQTISESWRAFLAAGPPSAMLHKFISTMPVMCSVALQLSGLGTARKIRRERSTGLLDPLPFVTMVSNCLVWSAYALLNANITCFVPNFTGYLFGTYYVTNFAKHTQVSMKGYYVGLGAVIAALCTAVLLLGMKAAHPIGLFGACSCVSMLASPLATIRQVVATKSTASLTFPRTLASFVFALSWFTYGLAVAMDPFIYVPNALGLLATAVQLSMFAAYGFGEGQPAPAMHGRSLKLA